LVHVSARQAVIYVPRDSQEKRTRCSPVLITWYRIIEAKQVVTSRASHWRGRYHESLPPAYSDSR